MYSGVAKAILRVSGNMSRVQNRNSKPEAIRPQSTPLIVLARRCTERGTTGDDHSSLHFDRPGANTCLPALAAQRLVQRPFHIVVVRPSPFVHEARGLKRVAA